MSLSGSRDNEERPLMSSPAPSQSTKNVNGLLNRQCFLLPLALIALLQAGITAPVVSSTFLLENIICRRLHENASLENCKDEAVQSRLAMLKGIASLSSSLPGIFLTVPFGALAQRYGTRHIMAVALIGILMKEVVSDLIYWMAPTTKWCPIELVWATPAFFILGGGPPAFISLLFSFVADTTPPEIRSSSFFQLEAAAYVGNIFSYVVSSSLTDSNPWIPIILGLVLLSLALILVLITATSVKWDQQDLENEQDTATDENTGRNANSSNTTTVREYVLFFFALVKQKKLILALLAGYWLRMLAVSVTGLQLIYTSRLFHLSYSKAAYINSLDSAVHLMVLFILPTIAAFITNRLSLDNFTRDWWLARASVLITAFGCIGLASSPTPWLIGLSVLLFGLGAGYSSSVRGLLTDLTDTSHRSLVFSVMQTLDIIGTLIGGPLWPAIYHVGLSIGGLCTGLPFVVAAVMFSFVAVTVEISKVAVGDAA